MEGKLVKETMRKRLKMLRLIIRGLFEMEEEGNARDLG